MLYDILQADISQIYNDYSFLEMPFSSFQDYIKECLVNNVSSQNQTVHCYLRQCMDNKLLEELQNPERFYRILTVFLRKKITFTSSESSILKAFHQFEQFLKYYHITLTVTEIKMLYQKSPEFLKMVDGLMETVETIDDDFFRSSFYRDCYEVYMNEILKEDHGHLYSTDSLKQYYREIDFPLLTQEEELELGKGVLAKDMAARKTLCERNLKLVVSIAKRYAKSEMELADLIQEGNIGLMKAVDTFDYRKGNRFSSYAYWWIRQAMVRAIANQSRSIRLPVHIGELTLKLKKASIQLKTVLGRTPTLEELAKECNIAESRLKEIQNYSYRMLSFSTPVKSSSEATTENNLGDFLSAEKAFDDDVVEQDFVWRMQEAFNCANLTERERYVIIHHFGLNGHREETLSEIGTHFGFSMQRAGQIKTVALKKLRNTKKIREQMDYLDQPELIRKRLFGMK